MLLQYVCTFNIKYKEDIFLFFTSMHYLNYVEESLKSLKRNETTSLVRVWRLRRSRFALSCSAPRCLFFSQ